MHLLRETLDKFNHISIHFSSNREFLDEVAGFLFTGWLSGQEEPEHSLRKGLGGTVFGGFGENAVTFRNGVTSETDTFLCVELGNIVEEAHHATHTAQSLVQSDILDFLATVLLTDLL